MLKLIAEFLFPGTVGLYPAVPLQTNPLSPGSAVEFNGAVVNSGEMQAILAAIGNNVAPARGSEDNVATTSGTTLTLTNCAGLKQFLSAGSAVTVTFDNAPNIVANIPGAALGVTFGMMIATAASTTVATPTVTNTGVTLSGTTSIAASSCRWYQGKITQLTTQTVTGVTAGTTYTSITQIGSTNLYTLAVGTNAIAQVVGNLIWIGSTAGTLPAGFYPTYSTGTTSIVVALPPSGTAWTCTAANMLNAPTTVPVTYAPLLTVTGIFAASTFIA